MRSSSASRGRSRLQRQMDVVANNIANINTTGFKSRTAAVRGIPDAGRPRPGLRLPSTSRCTTSRTGPPSTTCPAAPSCRPATRSTWRSRAKASSPSRPPAGERYTKSGSLAINADGTLVDLNGNPVLGDGGPIQFDAGRDRHLHRRRRLDLLQRRPKGRLRVVEFADPQATDPRRRQPLGRRHDPIAGDRHPRHAGPIEKSNVSGVGEMTEMIRVQRAYESVASLMHEAGRTCAARPSSVSATLNA